MKTLKTIALSFLIPLSAQAVDLNLPTGDYKFIKAEISYVRDVQLFSMATEIGVQRYEALKTKRYVCRHYPAEMVSCYKFQPITGTIDIDQEEVSRVTPSFGHLTRTEVDHVTDYEIIYNVFQPVDLPVGVAEGYRLHVREEGDYFIEVFIDGNVLRYQFSNPGSLRLLLKKREYRGQNHWLEYGIHSIYNQI